MKGLITTTLTVACAALAVTASSGCYGYRDVVDPCYPERYEYMARQEVRDAFAPQVQNGHVLDQTVWNWQFEEGTDRLHPAGMEHLDYIIRRRPHPDCTVYLETAHDLNYDPDHPERFVETRLDLDQRRVQAIQKYLTAASAGRPVNFQVVVHDPAVKDIQAVRAGLSVQRRNAGSQGLLVGGGATAGAVGPAR